MNGFEPTEFTVRVGLDRWGEPVMTAVCKAHPWREAAPTVITVERRDGVHLGDLVDACRAHWDAVHVEEA